MKELTNFNDYIGKYVRFDFYGTHCAKIIGVSEDKDDLILEGPIITDAFNFIPTGHEVKKVNSIRKVREIWHLFNVEYLEEINEQEYKDHLFELLNRL